MCVETFEGNDCKKHEWCYKSECVAIPEPKTLEEYQEALIHWRDHIATPIR